MIEMTETITADDASENFARLLRDVRAGREFVITDQGVAVARIVPEAVAAASGTRQLTAEQEAALARSLERLGNADWGPIEHIAREQIYAEIEEQRGAWRRQP